MHRLGIGGFGNEAVHLRGSECTKGLQQENGARSASRLLVQSSIVTKVVKIFTLICKPQCNGYNCFEIITTKAKELTVCTKKLTLSFEDGSSIKYLLLMSHQGNFANRPGGV